MSEITLDDFVKATFKFLNMFPGRIAKEIRDMLESDGYTEELFFKLQKEKERMRKEGDKKL